jgi:predicted metal-dependent peptidase
LGVKTAGIIIDTSGSIDGALLKKFISEINGIMEQTGCEVVVICADAEVQCIDRFREPITQSYQAKGGGGTDFRPAIAEMEKQDIDCCVYLTDMCGTFPEKAPSYPIMWATIYDQEPPFGLKVLVEYLNVGD